MYHYKVDILKATFASILSDNLNPDALAWLNDRIALSQNNSQFNTTFIIIPRKTGKTTVRITSAQAEDIITARPDLYLKDWTSDRLARSWLLLHAEPSNSNEYIKSIENLFLAAEVQELVALYSSLPLLAYPEKWKARCSEGIRSNISDVLYAIMCNNPYAAENLDEKAWNQMVLKAFFTEKPIDEIIGLERRSNETLANTLSDYAHERWAAHRHVNPQLWRCVGPFINELLLPDIKKLLESDVAAERDAAALAIFSSTYPPAKKLLTSSDLSRIENKHLTWKTVVNEINSHVLQQ